MWACARVCGCVGMRAWACVCVCACGHVRVCFTFSGLDVQFVQPFSCKFVFYFAVLLVDILPLLLFL